MKCPVHSDKDVIGYCIDCGVFGCNTCLTDRGKGERICSKCEKARGSATKGEEKKGFLRKLIGEKKPASTTATTSRSTVPRRAATTRKLVVYFKNKKVLKGTTYKLDIQSPGFYLIPLEPGSQEGRVFVYFSDLKSIHYVRNLEGRVEAQEAEQESTSEGSTVKAAFEDGETVEGRTMHHFDPSCQRFFLIPDDSKGNIMSMLIERSALKGLEVGDYRQGVFVEEDESLTVLDTAKQGRAPLSQNESMGDLYFSMKNYDAALTEYEKVKKDFPNDRRLSLKISICNFNRGVNFIKSRKYLEAKAEFEKIGEDDPIYDKARKKTKKIEKILREAQKMG